MATVAANAVRLGTPVGQSSLPKSVEKQVDLSLTSLEWRDHQQLEREGAINIPALVKRLH